MSDNAVRWKLLNRLYIQFFDYRPELEGGTGSGINLKKDTNLKYSEEMLQVRNHTKHGKCITFKNDKFKSYGLYYIRAE